MNTTRANYEQLVLEEEALLDKIDTCLSVIETIRKLVYREADRLHILTVEEIIVYVHGLETNMRTEWLHLGLKMSKLAYQLERE